MIIQFSILIVIFSRQHASHSYVTLMIQNISHSYVLYILISIIFPSRVVEWQPIESLSGTFKALHKGFVDVMYVDKPPSFYKIMGIFVYFAEYRDPPREGVHG